MLARFLLWLFGPAALGFLGFKAGESAQAGADKAASTQADDEVAHAVIAAENAAPRDRGAVARELRNGQF